MPTETEFDPELGWIPAIPLPYYMRRWRSLWRWRYKCAFCDAKPFKTLHYYKIHYVLEHVQPFQD